MNVIPGMIVDGRYLVEALLGTGGMAQVFLARHLTLGSRHAIKVLNFLSPHIHRRLIAEGQVQAALRHANVVTVTDAIDVGGAPALVMEYVRGPHLGWLLAQMRLSNDQIDDLARQMLAGIGAAHELGIVHRDLKPANLLLDVSRPRPVLKIADFGLVKVLESTDAERTHSGSTFGTPEYMAPEQVRDASRVDARADLFSVGTILYEMVTTQRCFQSEADLIALFNRLASGDFTPVEQLAPEAPARMGAAIRLALAPEREDRSQTAEQLRAAWFDGASAPESDPWADPEYLAALAMWANFLEPPPPLPVVPAPTAPAAPERVPPAQARASNRATRLAIVAAIGAVVLALGGLGLVGRSLFLQPAAVGVPQPPSPIAPVAPPPVAAPAPLAAVAPPVAPAPVAAPVRAPSPIPLPAPSLALPPDPPPPMPVAVAAPVPAAGPPRFEVIGAEGITLSLREAGTGRAIPLAEATTGRYTLVAFFEPRVPTEVASLDLGAGSAWTVRCSANAHRCTVKSVSK